MKHLILLFLLSSFVLSSFSEEKRNLLQKEAKQIDLAQSLVKDFSELDFPGYKDRNFWNNLPEQA